MRSHTDVQPDGGALLLARLPREKQSAASLLGLIGVEGAGMPVSRAVPTFGEWRQPGNAAILS